MSKIIQLLVLSIFVGMLLIPVANADIVVRSINIPDVVASSPPNYGSCKFSVVVDKTSNQSETLMLPVVINGETLTNVEINMKANDISKIVAANLTFPNAKILMTNPFQSFPAIPVNYTKALNPFMNPISSVQYDVQVGDTFQKPITVLVYADWSLWAVILDIVLMAATAVIVTRSLK